MPWIMGYLPMIKVQPVGQLEIVRLNTLVASMLTLYYAAVFRNVGIQSNRLSPLQDAAFPHRWRADEETLFILKVFGIAQSM